MNPPSGQLILRSGDQLTAALMRPLSAISLAEDAHGRPWAITLWHSPEDGTRIQSGMHDLAERIEVGVWSALPVRSPLASERFLPVPAGLAGPLELAILVIQVEGIGLESGLVLTSRSGQELVIVAGVFPCSLVIAGLGEAPHRFEPEYPLTAYLRCPAVAPGAS